MNLRACKAATAARTLPFGTGPVSIRRIPHFGLWHGVPQLTLDGLGSRQVLVTGAGGFLGRHGRRSACTYCTRRRHSVKKFASVGTVCAYPRDTPVPFSEMALGQPHQPRNPDDHVECCDAREARMPTGGGIAETLAWYEGQPPGATNRLLTWS